MAVKKVPIKTVAQKRTIKNKKNNKNDTFFMFRKGFIASIFFLSLLFGLVYYFRFELAYYFSFVPKKTDSFNKISSDSHIFAVLERHNQKVVGIDVSEYQGTIDWELVKFVHDSFPIGFVMVRATAGIDKVDSRFKENWNSLKKLPFAKGAYHYYRPNENSILQAQNFIKTVKIQKGDFPPILDIENLPKKQSMDSLKVGLKRWLNYVENHYKVRPIIYSGENYYKNFLKDDFPEYQFWIANYNGWIHEINPDWLIWQFSEKASVPGIKGNVDINIYNGTPKMLQYLVSK
jgi:lysozyme